MRLSYQRQITLFSRGVEIFENDRVKYSTLKKFTNVQTVTDILDHKDMLLYSVKVLYYVGQCFIMAKDEVQAIITKVKKRGILMTKISLEIHDFTTNRIYHVESIPHEFTLYHEGRVVAKYEEAYQSLSEGYVCNIQIFEQNAHSFFIAAIIALEAYLNMAGMLG